MTDPVWMSATGIAAAVSSGEIKAADVAEATLSRIAAIDGSVNAFTDITTDRARAEAAAVDAKIAAGKPAGPLAGVPFAVKNLFDVAGLPTRAGSKINRERAPATRDAVLIERLTAAGAVLVGGLNMGEYAYDFTGENAHDGACCNPHDLARMTGGSSSGSGAATAAGMAPISLGSDTNGSLRVPASLCGVFSLKPTYGRLPRSRTFGFVDSLDHLGPFARSVADLAIAYDVMQGHDAGDHACTDRPAEPTDLDASTGPLRIGLPGGWFAKQCGPEALAAIQATSSALSAEGADLKPLALDEAEYGRAAAYLITNSESAAFHLERLRTRAADYDPDTRDRFLAGTLLPAAWVARAQRVRAWWLARAMDAFAEVDAFLIPATPFPAPLRGQKELKLGGRTVPLRPNLGILSQPISCIGLPVVTVPVFQPGEMPIGVQVVTPPWKENLALQIARKLETAGIATAHPPSGIPA